MGGVKENREGRLVVMLVGSVLFVVRCASLGMIVLSSFPFYFSHSYVRVRSSFSL